MVVAAGVALQHGVLSKSIQNIADKAHFATQRDADHLAAKHVDAFLRVIRRVKAHGVFGNLAAGTRLLVFRIGVLYAIQPEMRKVIEEIYRYPLLQSATDTLNRQLKSGIGNQALAELVMSLRADARLCRVAENVESNEPQVICSLGLKDENGVEKETVT